MPKLPFKRKSVDEAPLLNPYLPTQMVDYTSLPPIEEETAMTRFRNLPLLVRIGAVLLPLLLLAAAGWGIWQYLAPPPVVVAEIRPQPVIMAVKAKVVSREAIAVEAQFQEVADGTGVTARLLSGDDEVPWAAAREADVQVQGGKATLRLTRDQSMRDALDADETYVVEITVAEAAGTLTGQAELEVPEQLKQSFFAAVAAEATPEPEPTAVPTPEPTPEPEPEPMGVPTVETVVEATLLISPTLGSDSVSTAAAGTTYEPLLRSPDNRWFLVKDGAQVGWLHAAEASFDAARVTEIGVVTPASAAVAAGPHFAEVSNGGNIRYLPDTERGTVLGQLHAGQSITVKAQTPDGEWLQVVAPEAEGWVSVTLLTVEPEVLAKVPTTK